MFTLRQLIDEIDGDNTWLECPIAIGNINNNDLASPRVVFTAVAAVQFFLGSDGNRVLVFTERPPATIPTITTKKAAR